MVRTRRVALIVLPSGAVFPRWSWCWYESRIRPLEFDFVPTESISPFLEYGTLMKSDEQKSNSAPRRNSLWATLRTIFLGSEEVGIRYSLLTGFALGLFGVTFFAYELNVFYHSGGVVFIPFHAAIVGVIAAFWVGYNRNGLLFGWVLSLVPFLGWHAEWATEISPRPLIERVAYVVRPDGLLYLVIIGAVVAVLGFIVGALARRGIDTLRTGARTTIDS